METLRAELDIFSNLQNLWNQIENIRLTIPSLLTLMGDNYKHLAYLFDVYRLGIIQYKSVLV